MVLQKRIFAHLLPHIHSRTSTEHPGPVRTFPAAFDCVVLSPKPRGVESKRIRQKERLLRCETPPSAAGGGTPGQNMSTKAEDEIRDRGEKRSRGRSGSGSGFVKTAGTGPRRAERRVPPLGPRLSA